jgi:hypothetical protein
MKISEAVKIINEGWVKKKKGFRVHFQKKTGSEFITEYVPEAHQKPLESEVAAWRLAWKLSVATKSNGPEIGEGDLVNIYVVDDQGSPVKFYATNEPKVFNGRKT